MEYNKFESQLGRSLRDHTIAVDTDALIRNIHGEKPRDRKFLLWCLSIVGLVSIGYGLWAFAKAQSNTQTNNIQAQIINAEHAAPRALSASINVEKSATSNVYQSSVLTPNSVNDLVHQEAIEGASTQTEKSISFDATRKTTKNTVSSSNLSESSRKKTNTVVNNSINRANQEGDDFNTISRTSLVSRSEVGSTNSIPSLEMTTIGYKYSLPGRKVECPDFSISKNKWAFSLVPEIGAYYPLKSLSTNETNELYVARKDQEQSLEGLAGSLYLRAAPKKLPIFIQSGISWHRHTERMNLKYDYTVKDTIQGIISITVSQTGDTITTIWGDIIQEKRVYGQKKVHHSFRLVDIPIGFGIHKSIGQFKVGVDAGILFNISMASNGRLYNGDTTFAAIDALPTEVFKKSVGMQYYAGVFASRSFGVGELYLNARMRFIPQDFTNNEALIRQRYQFTGLYVGYVINL